MKLVLSKSEAFELHCRVTDLEEELESLKTENTRLREALRFYADLDYHPGEMEPANLDHATRGVSDLVDFGTVARDALNPAPREEGA